MEVVQFEPDRAIGMVTHDGPVEIHGRATFDAVGEDQAILTMHVEIPGMDESMGSMITSAIIEFLLAWFSPLPLMDK